MGSRTPDDTIAAISTPLGEGGIGIVERCPRITSQDKSMAVDLPGALVGPDDDPPIVDAIRPRLRSPRIVESVEAVTGGESTAQSGTHKSHTDHDRNKTFHLFPLLL